jgi:diphosphomevalonate decarboxylase
MSKEASSVATKRWTATAPSNIALIKYMGKTAVSGNRPTNSSLSYTLSHLRSLVEIEATAESADRWEPLTRFDGVIYPEFAVSSKGLGRFLAHLSRVKTHFGYQGSFVVRSVNDFPSDCGLASSASSFAALTMAAVKAITELSGQTISVSEAADLSRQGSGSSCRSFFSPWSLWSPEGVSGLPELGYGDLLHQAIVVNDRVKAVSSSDAHVRVASSTLFNVRPERAEERARELIAALKSRDWAAAFEITWAEFWDMHALFETSKPSFGYMTAGSLEVLNFVRAQSWERMGDGPLVTMDAGPNIHLLYRRDETGLAVASEVAKAFDGKFRVISSKALVT